MTHPIGSCYTNGDEVWVHIPKCGSTSLKRHLGWSLTDDWSNLPCPLPGFVVVRHPVSRFFSGVAEYVKRRRHGHTYEGVLDEIEAGRWPVLDEHTMRQTDFILSTFSNLETVRLDDLDGFVSDRYGIELTHNNRSKWEPRESLLPLIREFYAADFELYEKA